MSVRWQAGQPLPEGVRRGRLEPLWDRVDRNRVKLAFFIVAYLFSIALSAGLLAGIAFLLLAALSMRSGVVAYGLAIIGLMVMVWAAGTAFVVGSVWVAYAMLRSEKRLLHHLGAALTPTGTHIATKMALKDMAIAAGFDRAPPLWLIPDCDRVNAFAVGRTPRTSVVGVTQGFVDRLDQDEQRAVLANLMARLCNGDVRWATAVSALVGPMWRLRERDLKQGDDQETWGVDPEKLDRTAFARRSADAAIGIVGYFVLYIFLIVITEYLLLGAQRNAMLTAEKADAEGMLLLKDPREMLSTLEKVLDANNTVPTAGEAYSHLFYCWAGFGFAPEDDPEFRRIARLREVLGVEGLVEPPREYMTAETPEDALPPRAPRLDAEE